MKIVSLDFFFHFPTDEIINTMEKSRAFDILMYLCISYAACVYVFHFVCEK